MVASLAAGSLVPRSPARRIKLTFAHGPADGEEMLAAGNGQVGAAFPGTSERRRLVVGFAFAVLTVGALVLLARRFTNTGWPLERAALAPVAGAGALYFVSYVLRALGWRMLFPADARPGRARCLAACGAAAASGVVLPFRLDYVIKVGTLRRMRGVTLGLEAIALSIISLGLVDAVAFLPLSISATAMSASPFRLPLIGVVLFGAVSCGILVAGGRLARVPFVNRRPFLARLAGSATIKQGALGESFVAWAFLFGCWTSRALGSAFLLEALGVGFSPVLALVVICLSAAASLIPIASGGVVANVGATAAVLLAVGVHRDQAIDFGLSSGLLLCSSAVVAALVGVAFSLGSGIRARPAS
jgi:Lysylphosphatidylglycerol synthase TM region